MFPFVALTLASLAIASAVLAQSFSLAELWLLSGGFFAMLAAAGLWRLAAAPLAVLLAAPLLLCSLSPAMAQAAAAAPAGPDTALMAIVSAAIGLFLAGVWWVLHRFLGVQLDRDARERLHMALTTGASLVLSRAMSDRGQAPLPSEVSDVVVDYARRSVPGAISRLAPGQEVLRDLAAAKAGEALIRIAAAATSR